MNKSECPGCNKMKNMTQGGSFPDKKPKDHPIRICLSCSRILKKYGLGTVRTLRTFLEGGSDAL